MKVCFFSAEAIVWLPHFQGTTPKDIDRIVYLQILIIQIKVRRVWIILWMGCIIKYTNFVYFTMYHQIKQRSITSPSLSGIARIVCSNLLKIM